MPRTRPPYPVEFRRETVELVRQGRSIADVAKSLGVSDQTLRNWCKQIEVDQGRREGLSWVRRRSSRSCAVACGSSSKSARS